MAGVFDDFLSYLMGGTQLGNMLGVGSPTASTQTPTIVPSGTAPTLGGAPPASGAPAGLLGGQQINPMSYFQPHPGLLGDSPLGNMLTGAFSGLGSAAGTGGLTGLGNAFTGGSQAVQDRRKQMMTTALAGQQFQQGQASMASTNMQIAEALRAYNLMQRAMTPQGQQPPPDLTYADVINDPQKLSQIMSAHLANVGQSQAGGQPATGGTGAATTSVAPIAPTILSPGPQPSTITSPTGVSTNPLPRSPIEQFNQARLQFEGGGDPNAVDPKSGAIAGLTQGTFDDYNKKFFGGKLNFANTADRQTVNDRLNTDLYKQSGGDINRMAVGYFSGASNMTPPGDPFPWKDPTVSDGRLNVPQYVNAIRKNLMLPPIDAGGAAQGQGGGQQVAAGGQGGTGNPQIDALNEDFKQKHNGYTQAEWYQIGRAMMNAQGNAMMEDAQKSDPTVLTGTAAATAAGTPQAVRPGTELQQGGRIVGENPSIQTLYDPKTGMPYLARVYHDHIEPIGTGPSGTGAPAPSGPGPGGTTLATGDAQQLVDWGKSQKQSLVVENQLKTITDALTQTQSGKWATNKADILSSIDSVLGEGNPVSKALFKSTDPAAVEVILRNQFSAAIGQILPNVSTPAQNILDQAQRSLADPNISPDANRKIIAQVIGTLRWDRDMYHAANTELRKNPGSPDDFAIQWAQNHPLDDYVAKADKELPKLKGQTTQTQAGSQGQAAAAPPTPKVGDVQSVSDGKGGQNKYRFTGGDPKDPNSWSLVP
jgi:hypothetical protein